MFVSVCLCVCVWGGGGGGVGGAPQSPRNIKRSSTRFKISCNKFNLLSKASTSSKEKMITREFCEPIKRLILAQFYFLSYTTHRQMVNKRGNFSKVYCLTYHAVMSSQTGKT